MKKFFILMIVLTIGLILGFASGRKTTGSTVNLPGLTDNSKNQANLSTSSASVKVDVDFGKIPLYFISNKGQVNKKAKFYAKASRYTLWLTNEGLVFDSVKKVKVEEGKQRTEDRRQKTDFRLKQLKGTDKVLTPDIHASMQPCSHASMQYYSHSPEIHRDVSRLIFLNANKNVEIIPVEETKLRVNYFKGNDRSEWHCNIPTTKAVLYKNLYKNIDLKVYGIEKQIEYDWIVKPGGNPGDIRFQYKSVKGTRLDDEGNLVIETDFGELIHKKPVSYQTCTAQGRGVGAGSQTCPQQRKNVNVTFKKIRSNTYGFEVEKYDKNYELIIDPVVLAYSTYLGGSSFEWGYDIAVDNCDQVYVTGETYSTDFPLQGQYQGDPGDTDYDAFVIRLDTLLSGESSLVYSTYLGGGNDDRGYSIAVGDCCIAYVTGRTDSPDFPTRNRYQGYQGSTDAFVTLLDTDQSGETSLIYSTYLGGENQDSGQGVSMHPAYGGDVFVTGYTDSTNFPVGNQFQDNQNGRDIFVTRLDTQQSGESGLIYSTYLGGQGDDRGWGIAVDMDNIRGVVYVTGDTYSPDFPLCEPYQSYQGGGDAFISKLDTNRSGGASMIYSTCLGGGAADHAYDIAVGRDPEVFVTGRTMSTDFPTSNQYQGYQGNWDAFVSRLNTFFSGPGSLIYSTYLGGQDWEEGQSLILDFNRHGTVYVTGYTKSTNFPILNQNQVDPGYLDVFVTRLDTNNSGVASLIYSTYLGGGASQYGTGIAVDCEENVYVTGETSSTDFPTLNPYQAFQGTADAFVTKIFAFQPALPTLTTTPVSDITGLTASSGGEITDDGGAEIVSRGVCWSIYRDPTIGGSHTSDGNGTGVFTSCFTGLTPSTVYYVRAYAVNAAGTAYGNEETFETDDVYIGVTYANGGEILVVGSGVNITWISGGVAGNVRIEYSIDDGQNWMEIVSSTENDGSYPWTVPYTPSYLCLIRVSEIDGSLTDTSDSVFTIAASSIVIPAGEREALIALYNSTRGFQWLNDTNWKKPDGSFNDPGTEHTWYGITVKDNHVKYIFLGYNELEGTLPAEIGNFPYLTVLDLSEDPNIPPWIYEPISGPIPAAIGNLEQLRSLDLSGNDFNGSIPIEIANLSNLIGLNLNDNQLTGSIPSCLGNLVNLEYFLVSDNRLSGNFPGILTNLVNLRHLELGNNNIEGNIPPEIGNLTKLDTLDLNSNALTGGIPSSVGNLGYLEYFFLNGNKLTGSIPTSLTNLSYFLIINIGYNALYTDDDALIRYLDITTSPPDWQDSQTIAPADVSAAVLSDSAIEVNWTPIIYTDDEGGYRVFYSTTEGGPYTLFDITADKTVSSMTVTGLNPGTTYYFVVQTRTLPCAFNENTVDSEYSNEVSAATFFPITVTSPNGGEQWQVGTQQTITWLSEGNVGNVGIEYSTNGGNSWGIITPSTVNDGSYNWTVPAKPSDKCLVRISEIGEDGSPSDVSDAVFSIVSPVTGSIALRSPNGGETWDAGSTREIKWNNTGDINYVTIKYSTDNGTTWKNIAKNAANSHSYNWVVPETVSDRCLVRVTANDSDLDPKPADVSDAVFSIILPPSPIITVTSPNGGEQLVVGSLSTITWNSTNTREDVRIEYSVNGGENWREITGAAENNGKYDWNVPDDPSDNCLVRISETGGQPSDISDAVFSIVQPSPGDIIVTSPNGGETWNAGSSHEITWTADGIDGVMIEYSRDYGTTWKTIVQTTPNSGIFDWTLPETVSSEECLVRITSNDVSNDPIPADVSDGVFSIVPPTSPAITVIAPNGGEQLPVGSMFNITWAAIQSREDVKIEYSVNGGDTWTTIAEAVDNTGDYEWLVPDTPSETCLVRISEIDGQPLDISDAVFSIVQPVPGEITVTAPNGGESWTVGSLQEIKWTAGGINNVTIECSTDYGTTWELIIQTTANDGGFDWTIPDTMSDECLVRVSSNDADPDPVPSDISDGVFSMVPDSAGELRVTSPNGGEEWEVGSNRSITWTNSGDINSVMIEYSYDNGNTWNTIVSSVSNSETYDWQVPDTVSGECLVRVSANDGDIDPQPSDVSDSVFSIVFPSSPAIRVITPNGGEQLVIGSIYEITWFGTDSRAQVKIEYSIDGSEIWTEIIDSTENDGDYDWTVPDEPSTACLVRISAIDGQPVDVSDAVFSIVQPQTGDLTVLTPNGGENLESGSEYNITWNCSGFNNIIIECSFNNGSTWLYIDTVPADNSSYPWTVPGTPSEMCVVRLTGADSDENPSDVSDGVFTIFDPSQASIEVFTPNGGESLSVGEEYYITWASTGINNVFIEYSTNNGEQWNPIDTVPAIGGRFTWVVPNTPSDSCLIRISGADSPGDPSDISDAVFSITSN